jgi:hypothetical protein
MVCITECRAREKFERTTDWIANSGFLQGWHRPHLGHVGAEMLQIGFVLAVFMSRLLYVVSTNDFRTGWSLIVSTTKAMARPFMAKSAHADRPAA